ncbi:MAG: hypothetical protein O9306_05760 [Beijerinckiaceae bacterium]|jgi:hypothetical protein|nr:hypothetical protein [Beijerinckiaceae bacterium]
MRMMQLSRAIRSAVVASMLALSVAGCVTPAVMVTYLPTFLAKSDEERASEIRSLSNPNSGVNDSYWSGMLGNSVIYLPDNYRQELTKDEDTFLKYAIGPMLNRFEITYDELADKMRERGHAVTITRETFNYYKGFGAAWEADLKRRNPGMTQRFELFRKRVGSRYADLLLFKPDMVRTLLRDDASFGKFLRDDGFATDWMFGAMDRGFGIHTLFGGNLADIMDNPATLLAPVTIGVLPGLAS